MIGIERGNSGRKCQPFGRGQFRVLPILSAPSCCTIARNSPAIYRGQPGYTLLMKILHGNCLPNLTKTYSAVFRRT